MKLKYYLIIALIIVVFLIAVIYPTINYKTWGNNELSYFHQNGIEIICDEWLWQPPQNCRPIISENSFPIPEAGSITIESDYFNNKKPEITP